MLRSIVAGNAAHRILAEALAEGLRGPVDSTVNPVVYALTEDVLVTAWDLVSSMNRVLPNSHSSKSEIKSLHRLLNLGPNRRQALHDEVFGLLISRECPPYETEYFLLRDSTFISQQFADIAGFYHAFGLEPDKNHPERVDHISLELDYVAHLLTRILRSCSETHSHCEEHREVAESALRKFVEGHLGCWVPLFCQALERRVNIILLSVSPEDRKDFVLYLQFAHLLNRWLESLCKHQGIQPVLITHHPNQNAKVIDYAESSGCESCKVL